MKKLIYGIILIFVTIITPGFAQSKDDKNYSSLLQEGIIGQVSKSEITRYSIDTASMLFKQDFCCITRTYYNKKGNAVRLDRLNLDGVFTGGTITKYHPNGLVKQIRFLNKDKIETAQENYHIDKNGYYSGGNAFDEGKLLRTCKINGQNKFGQWTHLTWYSLDGNIFRDEKYTYHENKKIAEVWKEYKDDPNGQIVQNMIYQYNTRGEMQLQQGLHSYLGQVNQTSNRIFEYDKFGNWILYLILSNDGKPLRLFKRTLIYRK